MESVMLKPRLAIDGTRRLTNPERGVYWDLIHLMYLLGGPIHDDDRWLCGNCNLSLRAYRKIKNSLIEKKKIHQTESGQLIANHVLEEIKSAENYIQQRRDAGKKGGRSSGETRRKSKLDEDYIQITSAKPQRNLQFASPYVDRNSNVDDSISGCVFSGTNDLGEAAASSKHEAALEPLPPPSHPPSQYNSVKDATGVSSEQFFEHQEPPPTPPKTIDPGKLLFDEGVKLLKAYGQSDRQARGLVAKWKKSVGTQQALDAVLTAGKTERHDVVSFIEGCLKQRSPPKEPPTDGYASILS